MAKKKDWLSGMSVSEKVKCIEVNDKKWWRRGGSPNVCFGLHNLIPQTYDIMWYIFDSGVFGDVVETPKTDTYFRPF